jgi:hypoxanthine phosphoribosyltransferase
MQELLDNGTIERVLFDEVALRRIVADVADRVSRDFAGRERPPVLVGVLTGCVHFFSDLSRALRIPHEIDTLAARSYGAGVQSSGNVRLTRKPELALKGRDVLIVDEIYDSGRTLARIVESVRAAEPATLEVCALFSKRAERAAETSIRYVGAEVPDRFLVGYGMDHAEAYRHLSYVGILSRAAIEAGKPNQ